MKVAFLDLNRLYLESKAEIDRAVTAVLGSGRYIDGPRAKELEEALVFSLRASGQAVSCSSGNEAFTLAVGASDIGPDDEVITVAYAPAWAVAAIRALGAKPVFVDVDPETWVIDPAKALAAVGPRTRALVAVHLYGNPAPVDQLIEGLRRMGRYDVSVIEDATQAQGAVIGGRYAGTLGRYGAFSFHPDRNVGAFGDGGAVFCASPTDAERLRARRTGIEELQAAVVALRLKLLDDWSRRRDIVMERYRAELKGLPCEFQKVSAGARPAWHLATILLESSPVRDRLVRHLAEHGVESLVCGPQTAPARGLAVTESLAKRTLALPLNPALTPDEQSWVISAVKGFYEA